MKCDEKYIEDKSQGQSVMGNQVKLYATCFWEDDASLLKSLSDYGFGKPEYNCCPEFSSSVGVPFKNGCQHLVPLLSVECPSYKKC